MSVLLFTRQSKFMASVFLLGSLFLSGCAGSQKKTSSLAEKVNYDHLIAATLWYQNSGEMVGLSYQAYQLAKLRLEEEIKKKKDGQKLAVIVDIDETVLDNSPYQGQVILTQEGYPAGWDEWVEKGVAKALPGSVEFLKFAASKDVEVFYITNRKTKGFEATLKNLQALGFPVKKENVMTRDKETSKKSRREKVETQNYQVVLLIGDNLNDFSERFEDKSLQERMNLTHEWKNEFGKRFIVLPNPMYGDWEAALYQYNWARSEAEMDKIRRDSLKGFK